MSPERAGTAGQRCRCFFLVASGFLTPTPPLDRLNCVEYVEFTALALSSRDCKRAANWIPQPFIFSFFIRRQQFTDPEAEGGCLGFLARV